ncbi:hypothetical protein N7532_003542 [Penicillium argentinense]|uniref:Uncharacterized protein n=1 Tax=Penicillium argentinense TaxID=1131581 RepID=A0A9W9FMN5_9EURO|nr:uncharacterized protein N7532_003542 [Penicillium argentinense]KAJ5103013.1 hypothetical protein N7532_003542 [Penicillium argentinense]
MSDPTPALRYIQTHLTFSAILFLLYIQQHLFQNIIQANSNLAAPSNAPVAFGKGNRKGRQNSQDSSSSADPIDRLVDPQTLASGEGELIGPSAARILDRKKREEDEEKDKDSLNIKIHLDLHAKVRLDLEADVYGDVVIGLL